MAKKPGPKTEAGCQRSSRNAAKHNMTSRQNIIPGENPEDLEALRSQWHELYPTDSPVIFRAVTRAADSEWRMIRISRFMEDQQDALLSKPMDQCSAKGTTSAAKQPGKNGGDEVPVLRAFQWTAAEHLSYALSQRYSTAARREHERDRRAIDQFRREARSHAREERALSLAADAQSQASADYEDMLRAHDLRHPDPNRKSDTTLKQYAHISVQDGVTVTFLSPPTEDILRNLDNAFDTTLVIRELLLNADPLPPEYDWANQRLGNRKNRTRLMLLMTGKSFRLAVAAETNGHLQGWPALEAADAPIIRCKLGNTST